MADNTGAVQSTDVFDQIRAQAVATPTPAQTGGDVFDQIRAGRAASPAPVGSYDTALAPDDEQKFQQWKSQYAPSDSGEDYDLRGAYKAGLTPDPQTGHWPDTFKKPNHPTFSNESKYATGANAAKAGHWEGPGHDQYVPAAGDDVFDKIRQAGGQQAMDQQTEQAAVQPQGKRNIDYEDPYGEGQSVLSRPITTYFGLPEFRPGAGPIEKGAEKFASSLTNPVSLALMLATGGLGSLAEAGAAAAAEVGAEGTAETVGEKMLEWVAKNKGEEMAATVGKYAQTIHKLGSVGFTVDQIRGVANQIPQVQADIKAGDWDAAKEHMTEAGLGAAMAAYSISHVRSAVSGEKYTYTPDREALLEYQKEVQKGNIAAKALENKHRKWLVDWNWKTGWQQSTSFDDNVAAKWYHEAGGASGEKAARNGPSPNPFPSEEIKVEPSDLPMTDMLHREDPAVPEQGEPKTWEMSHNKGFVKFNVSDDGKVVQVKNILGRERGTGQRLYDTAIQYAIDKGADEFKSDSVLTEDAKKAWQRLSTRYDVKTNPDGTYSIDLNELRNPTDTISNLKSWTERVRNLDKINPVHKERILASLERAQDLPQELKDLSAQFKQDYSSGNDYSWQALRDTGLVHDDAVERENYSGNRRYEKDDEELSAFNPSESTLRATKKPTALKGRSFDNMIDAMEKGHVPKNIGLVDSRAQYIRQIAMARGIVAAEKKFLIADDVDGRPIAVSPTKMRNIEQETSAGKTIKVKAVRIMDPAKVDPDRIVFDAKGDPWLNVSDYVEGPKRFSRNRVVDVAYDEEGNEKPIREQSALFFHPDSIEKVKQAFEDHSWVRKSSWASGILNTAQAAKKQLLSLSPFHYTTIGLRGLQMGVSLHDVMFPPEIDPEGVAVSKGTPHSLTLSNTDSAERSTYQAALDSESGHTKMMEKIPWLGPAMKASEDHLFGSWLPRVKALAFEKITERLREQNANWGEQQLYSTAARITNGVFGGMNWKALGVSASDVDMLRMVALAPDFTGSQIDTTMSAFKPGGSVISQSFGRIMLYNFLVAQATNLLLHGTVHMEHPFNVISPDGKKAWGMRTMPEDVWRSLTDTRSFLANRLNPLVKVGIEDLYGRDAQGKKLSDEQKVGELIRNVTPISVQGPMGWLAKQVAPQLEQKFKTGTPEESWYDSLVRSIGISPSSNRTPAESLASTRLSDRLPGGVADPDQIAKHHAVLDAEDQLRAGHTPDLRQFNASDRRQIITEGHRSVLQSKFGRLSMSDKLDVWQISTSEEKQQLVTQLLKERNKFVKGLTTEQRKNNTTYHRLVNMGLAPKTRSTED